MNALFRPTLVRRVFLALLAAFAIAWIALLTLNARDNVDEDMERGKLLGFHNFVIANLRLIDNDVAANTFLAGAVGEANRLDVGTRHAQISARLSDRQGRTLFLYSADDDAPLSVTDALQHNLVSTRNDYLVTHQDTLRWSLTLARGRHHVIPVILDTLWALSRYMLIAFPFILLPVWIAVSRGLKPLQQLSKRIAAKGDDLSPLNLDPKYMELQPLVLALDGLLTQLRGKLQREHAFVQDAAHELRTPIAVISAQAHVLSMAATVEARREAEMRMDEAIARTARLIQQLLQLAQMDDSIADQAIVMDIADLARQELAQVSLAAMARELDLRLVAPEALMCRVDQLAFQSILHNLLDNAIKYIHDGGQIVVELMMRDGMLIMSVADDGPGMRAEDEANIFERFHRGHGHDVPGSGLGLAIVKQAAIKLGGDIQLSTGLSGRGCQFTLTLPFGDLNARLPDVENDSAPAITPST